MKFFILSIALPLFLIWPLLTTVTYGKSQPIIYFVEQSKLSPNELTVRVNHAFNTPTKLILHGKSFGIQSQVQTVTCNGRKIKEEAGKWIIPKDCTDLHWQILLSNTNDIAAGEQQSIRSKDFIMISEPSSLPRLENAGQFEFLKINLAEALTTYPESNGFGIPFPDKSAAPLFILLNATNITKISSGTITLSYFLDKANNSDTLPNINLHMKGLQWLSTITQSKISKNFIIAWLGIAGNKMNLSGATGNEILLVNYPNDNNPSAYSKTMLLYIALHEAFHQFSPESKPAWLAESLASYYGTRTIQIISPENTDILKLINRFQSDAHS